MSVAKVSEIIASSPTSFDEAIKVGVARAHKTLKNVKSAWVENQQVKLDDEAMNTIQLGGTDWNDAPSKPIIPVVRRSRARSSRVSAYFGFDLPVTFPYYQGGNAGRPIQNPLLTPKP